VNGETLYIDMWQVPADDSWREWLRHQHDDLPDGLKWQRWEAQPIADQVKLHGCTNVPPVLPPWLERRS